MAWPSSQFLNRTSAQKPISKTIFECKLNFFFLHLNRSFRDCVHQGLLMLFAVECFIINTRVDVESEEKKWTK